MPGNPQTLNRFAYCGNNPLRYRDPSGHNGTSDFLYGVVAQFLYNESWFLPAQQSTVAAREGEPSATALGRHFGNILSLYVSYGEISVGGDAIAGGVAALVLSDGTLVGASAVAVGAGSALVVHGGGAGALALTQELAMLRVLLMARGQSGSGWGLPQAQGEVSKWTVDENLGRADDYHLDAVRRARKGEQELEGHIPEVRNARRGLNSALKRIEGALESPGWDTEARKFFLQQQERIREAIRRMSWALDGPLD